MVVELAQRKLKHMERKGQGGPLEWSKYTSLKEYEGGIHRE